MPKTLLLADDSVVIQKLVGLSFANEDVELVTTDNGDDALARAREIRPDLILADVVMPGKNGYEVCQAIKSDPDLSRIPVLLLTGTFEAFDETRAREVGSDGHITKPFEAQGLVDRVTDLLSKAPAAPPPAAAVPTPAPAAPLQAPMQAAPQAAPQAVQQAPVAPAANEGDDAYDFFEDDAQDLGAAEAPTPAPAIPAAPEPMAIPSIDDAFEFGEALDPMETMDPALDDPATLDTNFELDAASPDELTVAVMPGSVAAPFAPPPVPVDLDAPDATRVAFDEPVVAENIRIAAPAQPGVESLDAQLAGPPPVAAEPMHAIPIGEPAQTMLADDLFEDAAPTNPAPIPTAVPAPPPIPKPVVPEAPSMPPAMDSGFEFGREERAPSLEASPSAAFEPAPMPGINTSDATDPLGGMLPEPQSMPPVPEPTIEASPAPALADAADSTHSGYDVSSSDLGDPMGAPPEIPDLNAAPEPMSAPIVPEPMMPEAAAAPIAPEVMTSDLGVSAPKSFSEGSATPDLSPVMRDRIHETLEKIAWEAFADVSDSIVRQVIERVESIVWEVVPQMAEALIQEEIRRMKGDDD